MFMLESVVEKSKYLLSSITDVSDVLPNDINKNHAETIIYNPTNEELLFSNFL